MVILKSEKAFTLIEILVAFVILTVVAVPLTRVFYQGNYLAAAARDKTTALYLAQEKMEEIIARGSGENTSVTAFSGKYSSYSYKVETSMKEDMQLVTVTVSYSKSGHEEEVTLSTLLPGGG